MNDSMRLLAMKYFRGEIAEEEASRLADWVVADELHRRKLHEWEEEWLAEELNLEEREYDFALRARGKRKEERGKRIVLQDEFQQKNTSLYFPLSTKKRWLAAAAVVASLVAGAWVLWPKAEARTFVVEAPQGGEARITLPDGSHVNLNAASRLTYSSDFGRRERNVSLEGEASFDVNHDSRHAFTVEAADCQVRVMGTKFNVSAYHDDDFVQAELYRGSIAMTTPEGELTLKPQQKATWNRSERRLQLEKQVRDSAAWTAGAIEGDDITVAQLARMLSRRTGLGVIIADEEIARERITVQTNNRETADDIAAALTRILPVKIERKGLNIYITRK